jgi:hypothetical protein
MAKMVSAFDAFGVTKEHIEAKIQRRLDAITAAQVVQLKRVYASLRDGISEPSQWFDLGTAEGVDGDGVITPPVKTQSAAEAVAARRAAKLKTAGDAAAAAATKKDAAPPKRTLQQYLADMEKATDSDTATFVLDEARGQLSDDEARQLSDAYSAKWQAPE